MVAEISIDGCDLFPGDRSVAYKRGGVYVTSCLNTIRLNPVTKVLDQEW